MEAAGSVVLTWSNSFSMFTKKTVTYSASVAVDDAAASPSEDAKERALEDFEKLEVK